MGFLSVLLCASAAATLYGTGHPILFWISVFLAIADFWTWGVMHNFAMESAKLRRKHCRENFNVERRQQEEINKLDQTKIRIEPRDLNAVPDGLSAVNMIIAICGVVMLVWGIVVRLG
jgi:hypothetical protein